MKENLKIRVNDDNRQEVIDLLGKLGKSFCWDVKTRWSEIAAIFAYKKQNLEWDRDLGYNYFKGHSNKEITLPELRELAKLREYLNDKFELVVTNQPLDGFILVPDGAEYYADITGTGGYFYKFKQPFINLIIWHVPLKIWMQSGLSCNSLKNILWQRENKVETVKGRFLHQWAYEAFGRGEDVQFDAIIGVDWTTLTTVAYLSAFDNPNIKFRLKPQTIQIGSRTIVKPISVKPEVGDEYFMPFLSNGCKYSYDTWENSNYDTELLGRSLCHLTKEDAIAHCDAILELMK